MSAQPEPARDPAAVVVIGSYLVALVIEVERFPAVGETVNGGGYFETHGGKGSNMAVQAARLGARCAFVGRVGDDARGRSFRAMLTGEGVGTDHLHLQHGIATGVGFILLGPGGHNMIAIDSGANAQFSAADVDQAHSAMRPPATVLTQLEIPLATAMRGMQRGRDAGCTTILNPAPAQDLSAHDLASVSVITPNETEARVCLGMAPDERADEEALGRRLLERGCGAALLTLGARGCLCVTADGSEHVPGFAVPAGGRHHRRRRRLQRRAGRGTRRRPGARRGGVFRQCRRCTMLHAACHPAGLPHAPCGGCIRGIRRRCCLIAFQYPVSTWSDTGVGLVGPRSHRWFVAGGHQHDRLCKSRSVLGST